VPRLRSPEEANLRAPDAVVGLHVSFINAGAELIETNTSTEYWQKGASLLHTDPLGQQDLTLPENSRVYMIAGTQHGGRADDPA